MKAAWLCFLVMVAICAAIPGPASAQLVPYDDFQTKLLNPDKWFGKESSDSGIDILESRRQTKNEPIYGFKGLNIVNRSYASGESDTGRSSSSNRLVFDDGSFIKTIQSIVLVKKFEETACATNVSATEPRVRIGGMFFNTGASTPGDSTNDINAFIIVGRPSDATDLAAGEFKIYAKVNICNDPECGSSTELGSVDIGTVMVNKKAKLRISWDPANNRFVFQNRRAAEVYITYAVPVGSAPGTSHGGNKRLEVHHLIPNCTTAPRPVSFMEAFFDNIMIEALP